VGEAFITHTFIVLFTSHGENKTWESTPQESLAFEAEGGSRQLCGGAAPHNPSRAIKERIATFRYKSSQQLHSV